MNRFYLYTVAALLLCMIDICLKLNEDVFNDEVTVKSHIPELLFFAFIYMLQFLDNYFIEIWRLSNNKKYFDYHY
jgi:hypothetical protein